MKLKSQQKLGETRIPTNCSSKLTDKGRVKTVKFNRHLHILLKLCTVGCDYNFQIGAGCNAAFFSIEKIKI